MKLEIIKEDPLNILSTTRDVMENARHVSINKNKINDDILNKISERFKSRGEEGLGDRDREVRFKGR